EGTQQETKSESKDASAKETAEPSASSDNDSRIKASPLARKLAKEKGINLSEVKGSADGGRIVKKDIENFKPAAKAEGKAAEKTATEAPATEKTISIPQYIGEERYTEKPVSQMRKTIAKRLSESLYTAPHFFLT